MNAQEYIISRLESLKSPAEAGTKPEGDANLSEAIFKLLMSKKFRKFSVPAKNQEIIRAAIEKNVSNGEPIKVAFPFGGYKLWRLEESPEVDWAELFSMMHLIRWLKPVCALYPKGATLTFWFDEVVISKLNNVLESDLVAYRESFKKLITFLKEYMPENLKFEIFLERSRYKDYETFESELAVAMDKLEKARSANPQPLSDEAIRSIEMNVKTTPEQLEDPNWREKVDLMHYAYYNLQESHDRIRRPYVNENITVFTVLFDPNVIPIGSTKTSIVRFWVGVGVLEKKDDAFIENILSISQLEKADAIWQPVSISGLEGKNFKQIKIVN